MSYKPEESILIAYLYGELSVEETKKVEEYLSGNDEARDELKELEDTLSIMGQIKDKEVEVPTFTFNHSSKVVVGGGAMIGFWRKSMAIAASIALILFMGYITKFNASYTEDGFELAFGKERNGYNQSQVEAMIADAISKNNADLDRRFENTEAGMKEFVSNSNQSMQAQFVSQINVKPTSESDFEYERQQYLAYLKQLIEDSESAQKRYTDQAMTDFAIFLDIQRQNDLQVIQTRFNNLEDNAELNQLQTNEILANLISSVDDPNPNQY